VIEKMANDESIMDDVFKQIEKFLSSNDTDFEGKKTISIIDQRINKLDEIPNEDYDKSKDDFINDVYKVTTLGDQTESQFESLLKQLNELLGVNPSQSK
jgi:hypothetical protein